MMRSQKPLTLSGVQCTAGPNRRGGALANSPLCRSVQKRYRAVPRPIENSSRWTCALTKTSPPSMQPDGDATCLVHTEANPSLRKGTSPKGGSRSARSEEQDGGCTQHPQRKDGRENLPLPDRTGRWRPVRPQGRKRKNRKRLRPWPSSDSGNRAGRSAGCRRDESTPPQSAYRSG